jgi:hypothetical protein
MELQGRGVKKSKVWYFEIQVWTVGARIPAGFLGIQVVPSFGVRKGMQIASHLKAV